MSEQPEPVATDCSAGTQHWTVRKHRVVNAVSELSGSKARELLEEVVRAIVTDNAGNSNSPFAYMWRRRWLDIESKIVR